jgi:hypothetical protein
MLKYLIERDLPGAGKLSPAELKAAAQNSNGVLKSLGPEVQWVQSYVTDNKIYCVYYAASIEIIKEHAKCAGIPANRIEKIRTIIDPTTGDA